MGIKKFLKPRPSEDKKLLQARIESDLYERLKAKLKKEKVEVREFVEAAARAYLEEK